jgi:hypothetical protein
MSADETKPCRDENCLSLQRQGTPFKCYCQPGGGAALETKAGHGFVEGWCYADDAKDLCHAVAGEDWCHQPRSAHPGEETPEPAHKSEPCRLPGCCAPTGIAESRFCNEKFIDGPVEKACVLPPQHPGDQHSPYLPMAGIAEEPRAWKNHTIEARQWLLANSLYGWVGEQGVESLAHSFAELRVRSEGGGEKRSPGCSCDARTLRLGMSAVWCNADCARRFPLNPEASAPSGEKGWRQSEDARPLDQETWPSVIQARECGCANCLDRLEEWGLPR